MDSTKVQWTYTMYGGDGKSIQNVVTNFVGSYAISAGRFLPALRKSVMPIS